MPCHPTYALLTIILTSCRQVVSAPIQVEPAYVPDPQGRGTFDLLSTCVITFSLCVWTAIHLNIPRTGSTWRSRNSQKLFWAALAVFAPEVVLWRAIAQWHTARTLSKYRNSISAKWDDRVLSSSGITGNTPPQATIKQRDWTIEHGFFAIMGGLTVRVPKKDEWILDDGCTLTPRGVLFLARLNLLPEIPRETIVRRGKVDSLAKALVCFQAGWMVIQTIARRASGLPITLLELNTLAHVVCAVIMYGAWWYKPQDANEPLVIDVAPPIAALLSSYRLRREFFSPGESCRREDRIRDDEFWQLLMPPNKTELKVLGRPHKETQYGAIQEAKIDDGVVMLLCGQRLESLPLEYATFMPRHLTTEMMHKLHLPFGVIQKPKIGSLDFGHNAERRLVTEAGNMRIFGNLRDISKSYTLMLLALLNALYGGLHATSWNSHFPTHIEQIMWRVSVCVV